MQKYRVPTYDTLGRVKDRFHRPLLTIEALDEAFGVDYDNMPSGTTITLRKVGGVWPGVPTTRADITIIWKGAAPLPGLVGVRTLNQPGFLTGVDIPMVVA